MKRAVLIPVTRGCVIRIPRGTPVLYQEDDLTHHVRKDHVVAVVYWYEDADELGYRDVQGRERFVERHRVELLVDEDHQLTVGRRRVIGGSPVRGWGSEYATTGTCACGEKFKCSNAREVRDHHYWHLQSLI